MADKTAIEWADATWNPLFGCSKVSPGCANCYAETFAMTRMKGKREYTGLPWTPENAEANVQLRPERLDQPLRWQTPRRIFVNSLSDLFHENVPDDFIARVWAVMAMGHEHTFQVLTKRPDRMRALVRSGRFVGMIERHFVAATDVPRDRHGKVVRRFADRLHFGWPIGNIWLGTSVENARWRVRIDDLRQTPAAVRFLSCEPLLGSLTDWTRVEVEPRELGRLFFDLTGIDWVIVGGESGAGARPMDPAWVRDIVDACRMQGAKPFVKQMGDVWSRANLGHPGHGGDIATFPLDLQVREYPEARA